MCSKLYIILTGTNTILNKTIRMYTRKNFNHVSISFDPLLNNSYSFGRKNANNPFVGSFIREDYSDVFFNGVQCEIYEFEISREDYINILNKVKWMEVNKSDFKYNFIGLFGILFNIKIKRKNHFFCSEFVATLLKDTLESTLFENPSFVQPHHFSEIENIKLIYKGEIKNYLKGIDLIPCEVSIFS